MDPTQSEKYPARANMSSEEPKDVRQNQHEIKRPSTIVGEVRQEEQKYNIKTVENKCLCLDTEPSDIYIPLNLNKPVFIKSSFAVKWDESVLEHANYIAQMIMTGDFEGNAYEKMDDYTRRLAVKFSKEQEEAIDEILRNEGLVLETSFAIRNSLPIISPNLPQAIKHLDEMDALTFYPLLFKKFPCVVLTIRNCTRYVGNTKDSSMTTQEIEDLKRNSQIIRRKAKNLFEKVKKLFNVPEGKSFYSEFTQLCKEFGTKVSHLSMQEVFTLVEEPT